METKEKTSKKKSEINQMLLEMTARLSKLEEKSEAIEKLENGLTKLTETLKAFKKIDRATPAYIKQVNVTSKATYKNPEDELVGVGRWIIVDSGRFKGVRLSETPVNHWRHCEANNLPIKRSIRDFLVEHGIL